jgi:hypothetical protein
MKYKVVILTTFILLLIVLNVPSLAVENSPTVTPVVTATPVPAITATITPKPENWFKGILPTFKAKREELRLDFKDARKEFNQESKEIRKDSQEDSKEIRQEIRTTIKQERTTLWTEFKKKRVQMAASRIQTELELRYKIVQKLKTKIGERITNKSVEFDTAAASAKLTLFSDAKYQTDMTDFKTKITALTASSTPKELLEAVKQSADTVRKDLREMHLFLVDVMKLVATSPKK